MAQNTANKPVEALKSSNLQFSDQKAAKIGNKQ
jgi:hypothetical protein